VAEIRLDHVVFAFADWERSNQFYRNPSAQSSSTPAQGAPPIASAGSS
jgi:hypothetical protein